MATPRGTQESKERERIAAEIRRGLEGDAWHGPSLMAILEDVSAAEAYARPVPGAHSIFELVQHLVATAELVLDRLRGEPHPWVLEESWPAPPPETPCTGVAEAAPWPAALVRLRELHEEALAGLRSNDLELDAPVVAGGSSVYETLHGFLQHDLYHGGQIALLKKALRT